MIITAFHNLITVRLFGLSSYASISFRLLSHEEFFLVALFSELFAGLFVFLTFDFYLNMADDHSLHFRACHTIFMT
jgi:hypothetical protein